MYCDDRTFNCGYDANMLNYERRPRSFVINKIYNNTIENNMPIFVMKSGVDYNYTTGKGNPKIKSNQIHG